MPMATNTTFDYDEYVRRKLEPHPPGRTTDELEASLPADADSEALHDALDALVQTGAVKRIGEKWRWMEF